MAVQLAGYKVKCMLAEPKGKRTYIDTSWSDPASPLSQQVSSNPNGTAFVSLIKICCLSPSLAAAEYKNGGVPSVQRKWCSNVSSRHR